MSTNHGGCLCGAVKFTTTGDPIRAMACHCTNCKLRTGAPYGIGVYFEESAVSFEGGELNSFQFTTDTTGRWIQNEFCAQCGTTVSWTLEMRPGLRAIAGGSYDNPDWYKLEAHIWARSARSDMCFPEGAKVCEQALI